MSLILHYWFGHHERRWNPQNEQPQNAASSMAQGNAEERSLGAQGPWEAVCNGFHVHQMPRYSLDLGCLYVISIARLDHQGLISLVVSVNLSIWFWKFRKTAVLIWRTDSAEKCTWGWVNFITTEPRSPEPWKSCFGFGESSPFMAKLF